MISDSWQAKSLSDKGSESGSVMRETDNPMIIGNPSSFAIESSITQVYERISFLAMGYFVIHVAGRVYGVQEPYATMLACSYEAVIQRIGRRGSHTAPFSEMDAGQIALAYRKAIYADEQGDNYLGMSPTEFRAFFYETGSDLQWAPDGDEAFDDGSHVLQFDVGSHVRVIAFKSVESWRPDLASVVDVWMPADTYYDTLKQWSDAFMRSWKIADYPSE